VKMVFRGTSGSMDDLQGLLRSEGEKLNPQMYRSPRHRGLQATNTCLRACALS